MTLILKVHQSQESYSAFGSKFYFSCLQVFTSMLPQQESRTHTLNPFLSYSDRCLCIIINAREHFYKSKGII